MNLKRSTDINSKTAFVFGKAGSGYEHLALQEAAKHGSKILIVAFVAVDGLQGKSLIDGAPLPEFDFVEVLSVDAWNDLTAGLNELRGKGESYDSIVLLGLSQFATIVATDLVPNGQPSQQQFGQIAREVNNSVRLLRGQASGLFVTCDVREVEDEDTDRFNVQPAVYNAISGELANAFYVSVAKDGSRKVQRDPLLALKFVGLKEDRRGETPATTSDGEQPAATPAPTPEGRRRRDRSQS